MPIRLKINEASIQNGAIVISKLSVICGESGDVLKIASITPELLNLFLHIEIDVTDYMKVQEAIKSNSAFAKLVDTFSLVL